MQIVKFDEEFEILGLRRKIENIDEISCIDEISKMWQEFLSSNYNDIDEIYAVYSDHESDFRGKYSLCIGTKSPSKGSYDKVAVKCGRYAVFSKKGSGADVVNIWREIYSFFESSELQRAYTTDFERYLGDKIEVYISLKDVE